MWIEPTWMTNLSGMSSERGFPFCTMKSRRTFLRSSDSRERGQAPSFCARSNNCFALAQSPSRAASLAIQRGRFRCFSQHRAVTQVSACWTDGPPISAARFRWDLAMTLHDVASEFLREGQRHHFAEPPNELACEKAYRSATLTVPEWGEPCHWFGGGARMPVQDGRSSRGIPTSNPLTAY